MRQKQKRGVALRPQPLYDNNCYKDSNNFDNSKKKRLISQQTAFTVKKFNIKVGYTTTKLNY